MYYYVDLSCIHKLLVSPHFQGKQLKIHHFHNVQLIQNQLLVWRWLQQCPLFVDKY